MCASNTVPFNAEVYVFGVIHSSSLTVSPVPLNVYFALESNEERLYVTVFGHAFTEIWTSEFYWIMTFMLCCVHVNTCNALLLETFVWILLLLKSCLINSKTSPNKLEATN